MSLKRILYLTEDTESAQFRYRCKNVEEALQKSKKWRMEWCLKLDIKNALERLDEIDVLTIGRQTAKDDVVLDLIKEAQERDVTVLFDLDDLIFDYRNLPLLMRSTNSKNVFYWSGYFWGIRRIAKRVDGFLCTNEFLAGKLERSFKKPVKVIRNSLNSKQIEVSKDAIKEKKVDGDFKIGYFSGSPTHTKDFRLIEGELIDFLKEHDDAFLEVVGDMDYSEEIGELIKKGRVKTRKKVDYLKLQELVASVDVNLAPLLINDFTNCKSELKYFEAGVVKTTTIASPAYAFNKAIKNGENGYLAQLGEWHDKLEYLYMNPKINFEVASKAKVYSLKHYYGKEFLKEVEMAYDGLSGSVI